MSHASRTRTLGGSAQWVVDGLTARGIDVNPSSRLGRFARQFAKNAYTGPWGPDDQALLIEALMAMRDVEEVAMILDEFPATTNADLKKLVDDAPLPRTDRSTPGRDRQLELIVGAICQRGKMPVRLDVEPDLWCEASRVWLGLAVKRVRSPDKFGANFKNAADQIQRSPLSFGFACMEVSLAWNQDLRAVLTQRSEDEVAHDLRERLSRFLDEQNDVRNEVWERFPKMLGLLCMDHTFTHHEGLGWHRDQFSMFCLSDRNDRHRAKIACAFRKNWIGGSTNCVDMDKGYPRTGMFAGPPVDKIMPLRPGSGSWYTQPRSSRVTRTLSSLIFSAALSNTSFSGRVPSNHW